MFNKRSNKETFLAGPYRLTRAAHLSAGQSAYDTGLGFWMGYDGDGDPRFSVGDGGAYRMLWDGNKASFHGEVRALIHISAGDTAEDAIILRRMCTLPPAPGLGGAAAFQAPTLQGGLPGGYAVQGRISTEWVEPTAGSNTARLRLTACDYAGEREAVRVEADGAAPRLSFFGATAVPRQTITGSRGGNTALANLLAALALLGLITDNTTP